ncbi:MAG: sigma-54 interaction domain-containing protein [Planctomycetota bacterium]
MRVLKSEQNEDESGDKSRNGTDSNPSGETLRATSESESGMPKSTPSVGRFLKIEARQLTETLLMAAPTRHTMAALLDEWHRRGYIRSGAYYLRLSSGWTLVAHTTCDMPIWRIPELRAAERLGAPAQSRTGAAAARSNGRLGQTLHECQRIILRALETVATEPVPERHGRLYVYPLQQAGEDLARLIIIPGESWVADRPPGLPADLHLVLGLYSRSINSLEELEASVAPPMPSGRDSAAQPEEDLARLRLEFPEVIGKSDRLRSLLDMVVKAAPRDVSVLIQGESGTGKELIGRALHRLSPRCQHPFVSENCAALSESLLEAEIFGWEKGAFTGAHASQPGLIERANGGTLFLDEVGEMSPGLQAKLLRTLQEREVRRVGGSHVYAVDFRLITATHRDLEEEALAGRFREDLLYRIKVIRLDVPPLRARPSDIPLLVHHYLGLLAARMRIPTPPVLPSAMRLLCSYPWPGNVRQLANEIERALTLTPDRISIESFSQQLARPRHTGTIHRRIRSEIGESIQGVERTLLGGIISDVLEETSGNKTAAARILGIPKSNLYRRMKKYGLA